MQKLPAMFVITVYEPAVGTGISTGKVSPKLVCTGTGTLVLLEKPLGPLTVTVICELGTNGTPPALITVTIARMVPEFPHLTAFVLSAVTVKRGVQKLGDPKVRLHVCVVLF